MHSGSIRRISRRKRHPILDSLSSRGLRRRPHEQGVRDEAGAVLILALVFLVTVGAVVGSLASWAMNDLNNTAAFTSARSMQNAVVNATELAIQTIRYTPALSTGQTLNASPPTSCWGSGSSTLASQEGSTSQNVAVWCSTAWNPSSANTRVVTLSACPVTSTETATTCAANPYLQVVAIYDDYPAGVISAPTTAQCVVYCGTGLTVSSWIWSPTVPTVTGLSTSPATSPTSGPITGNTTVTVSGTGFVSGATTVNFVEESGGSPTSDNVVLAATNVVVSSGSTTSLTATAPSAITGTSYFVTVATPGGTSPYSSNDIYTYSLVTPTVTGFGATSPTSGSTAGGTSVTVTGTGFVTGAVVNLTEESGGSVARPSVVLAASSVTVSSDTSLTAVSPGVTTGTTYFVTVTTPKGTSATTTSAVFTYSPLVPVVAFVSPTAGTVAGGTLVTITGTGFVSGATTTVNFVEESGGSAVSPGVSLAATNVNVVGSTTITALSPAVTAGSTYFVTVTTASGISSNSVVFTFS
jgi:hypothetical protein